jgi:hypothetical protein
MRTLLGMQYGGNAQQQYPRRELQFQPQSFQEGGGVSSGLAALLRGKKKREALDAADEAQRAEVKKQKRSGLWGSIGGLGGGLLGSAALGALGFTPAGIPLALAAGLGTGLGKAFGSKTGYEGEWSPGVMFRKAKSEKAKDIMYGKQAGLEDIERAGRDYTGGIDTAAGVSGLKAGLTAGLSKTGGIYGKAGKFGQKASAGFGAPGAAIQSSLGLSEAPESLTGGAPTLRLPQARIAIAGTKSGLLGEGIPKTLGRVPSAPPAVSDAGTGALSGGADISREFQAAKLANEASLQSQSVQEQMSKLLSSPTINKYLGNASDLSSSSDVLSSGAGDVLDAYTGTAAQNRALLEAGNYEGDSIIDALKKAGLDSSKLGRQNMWQNLFAPQIAGLMGGGMIRQNPQSLLGYLG